MTKKPVLLAEREKVQDICKIFDEQVFNDSSLSNPYPMAVADSTSTDSASNTGAPLLEKQQPDNPTKIIDKPSTARKSEQGPAITPYANVITSNPNAPSNASKGKGKSKTDEFLKNPRLANDAIFNENIVDRFSSVDGGSDKWETIKTIMLITAMVGAINGISILLGLINGEITSLGSIIGSGIMFFVLFVIVLFSWFTVSFVRNIPIKGHYSRTDIKTKRKVAKYETVLKSYFLDFIATKTVKQRLTALDATPPNVNTIKAITNFDNSTNDKTLSSRAVMLTGICTRGESKIPVSVTLNFNKNYSKLQVQDYKIG